MRLRRLDPRSRPAFRLRPVAAALRHARGPAWPGMLVAAAVVSGIAADGAHAQLASGTLPVPAPRWLQSGTGASYTHAGNRMRVQLSDPATVLNWKSMDIGSGAALNFVMPSETARVLNNVEGGAIANRTTIEGALRANGQVYIYNPNGILFGPGATVDVNSLVASTLRIDEARFRDGLLSPSIGANLAADPARGSPGAVIVQADSTGGVLRQAVITAAQNGLVLLAAPQVTSAGRVNAPDGQVILAGGSKVYVAAPTDAAMRGLRVEVSSDGLGALGGSATNNGTLSVGRGNITMAALAVNQNGLASASTSVNLNGSIYLQARDGAVKTSAANTAQPTHGGTLTLGGGSSTSVLPTLDDPATAQLPPAGQPFKPSEIELSGRSILLEAGAQVLAPGGNVTASARANPGAPADATVRNDSSIVIAPGSVIDVSGTASTVLPMSANVVTAELRGTELADNVLLRDSPLRGASVKIDSRKAVNGIAVANVQGYLNLAGHTVGEFTASGGTVNLSSEGSVNLQPRSIINVSGGQVAYQSGTIESTKLTLGGRLYDIETAPANLPYDGAVTVRTYEAGYADGRSAGTVQVSAPAVRLDGTLEGQAVAGIRQRDTGAASAPQGGQLLVGNVGSTTIDASTGRANVGAADQFVFGGAISVGSAPAPAGGLQLDVQELAQHGFSRVTALTTGDIRVTGDIALPDAGQLRLGSGGSIDVEGSMRGAGAAFTAAALDALRVHDGAAFDFAGRWQNDSAAAGLPRDAAGRADAPLSIRGGSVRLYANRLDVGTGASFDVSGGAWLNASGTTAGGAAGSVVLQATPVVSPLDATLNLAGSVSFRGYGLSSGGSIAMTGRNVSIGGTDTGVDPARDLALPVEFFATGGFASRSVTANGNLSIAPGAVLAPRTETWLLADDAARAATGPMASVASPTLLPLAGLRGARPAGSVTLRATSRFDPETGVLTLGTGSAIEADPGAAVTLAADRQVRIDGRVEAPAGTIDVPVLTVPTDPAAGDGRGFGVWLGPNARLAATGTADRVLVDGNGVASGELLDGGTVRIGRAGSAGTEANVGHLVMESGSVIDVSGTVRDGLFLRSGSATQPAARVASAGGTIELKARDGIEIAGHLAGAGGDAGAHGGTLSIGLDREEGGAATTPVVLTVSPADPATVLAPGAGVGQRLATDPGHGKVPVASFSGGGFGTVRLKSQDTLAFDAGGTVALAANASVQLDAPNLDAAAPGVSVRVAAPYVSLGNADVRYQAGATDPTAGDGTLAVQARVLDLVGSSSTHGFGQVGLAAREDVRLVGSPSQDAFGAAGAFRTGPSLTITGAQVYPTTLSDFTLSASGAGSVLRFGASGETAGSVLSAGGTLTATADRIVQGGSVRAPFGSITLDAGQELRYEPGSLTSVAGDGTVPLGSVVNGRDWTYTMGSQSVTFKVDPATGGDVSERGLPTRQIVSRAPSVLQAAGAVLDASGGGKLYAYEFTPGPGGSADVLGASGGNRNQAFAILPGFRGSVAPSDLEYGSAGLKAGDQVWLSGIAGLPEGYYTLLPAHYALQPGAFLIEPASGTRDMSARDNRVNADGSFTVAGYRASSLDGLRDARTQGFQLYSGGLVRRRSEYKDYDADTFFSAQAVQAGLPRPALPADGGRVVFEASSALDLAGQTRLGGSTGTADARRGQADISAPALEVVSSRSDATGMGVAVLADQLTALQADSLLLGGVRTEAADGTHVTVDADRLRIQNDSAHPLAAPELLLAASDTVQLAQRASLDATGAVTAPPQPLVLDAAAGDGDGALLRASAADGVAVTRPAFSGAAGRLEIATGATVRAGGSLFLDATASMALGSVPQLAAGGDFALHAPRIALGDAAPDTAGAARLGADSLSALGRVGRLDLTSYGTLDAWGPVQLGGSGTTSVRLAAGTLQGHSADLRVQAGQVVLAGADAGASAAGDDAAGRFSIDAQSVTLAGGTLHLRGFGQSSVAARGELLAAGSDSGLVADNTLALTAARIGVAAGATGRFVAGDLLATQSAGAGTELAPARAGGNLVLEGRLVRSGADIAAPSGSITLQGAEGLTVTGGTLDVHGGSTTFGTTVATTPGGQITLDGGSGGVHVEQPARIDLSAAGGSAGSLTIRATGGATAGVVLAGHVDAHSDGDPAVAATRQGTFSLDVAALQDGGTVDALNAQLNDAGFTESRTLRVHSGDLRVGAGSSVQSRQIVLEADNGNVDIAGTLDARGASGGSIEVYAAQADGTGNSGRLAVAGTARLLAGATTAAAGSVGSTGDGGRVVLAAANADGRAASRVDGGASVRVDGGAVIDVSPAGAGDGGTLLVRAPRVGAGAGSEVAVSTFGATVLGSRDSRIEGVRVYQADTISERPDSATNLDAGVTGRMTTEADRFMAAAPAVAHRLGRADVVLAPGVEVRSDGSLDVSVNEQALDRGDRGWNLQDWRFGGRAGTLTLRAGGDLTVHGSISDGFERTGAADALTNWSLASGTEGWSLRLVGGSDFGAANPLAVKPSVTGGDVRLGFGRAATEDDGAVAVVRTGTGRIDVAAGRDVVLERTEFSAPDSDPVLYGAQMYSAGRAVTPGDGFVAPVNARNARFGDAVASAAQFGTDGGAITITADRDVRGPAMAQLVNGWLFRQGRSGVDASGNRVFDTDAAHHPVGTAWWVRPDYFTQGVATFAGGGLRVQARTGDVVDLSANVASDAWVPGLTPADGGLHEQGGGDLRVQAGGSILGGSFYAQKGNIALSAGRDVAAGNLSLLDLAATGRSDTDVFTALRPVIALGDGQADVVAGRNLAIETVYNPTLARQNTVNVPTVLNIDSAYLDSGDRSREALAFRSTYAQYGAFSTYGPSSQVRLTASGGDLELSNNTLLAGMAGGDSMPLSDYGRSLAQLLSLYPSTLRAAAPSGSLTVGAGFALAPSPTGQLDLLARGDVRLGSDNILYPGTVMLDNDPAGVPSALAPGVLRSTDLAVLSGRAIGLATHTPGTLHAHDAQPARVIALTGSITGAADQPASLLLPKRAEILAGQDIRDLGFSIQQADSADISTVVAGRDIMDTTRLDAASPVEHVVSGAGLVAFTAGRDVDLGNGQGIVTRGNLDNAYLPSGGAGVVVEAGVAASRDGGSANAADVLRSDEQLLSELFDVSRGALTEATTQAAAAGVTLTSPAGIAIRDAALARFDALVAGAYPAGSVGTGDIKVFGSQIKTEQGGSIDLLAPGGSVIAGLVSIPSYLQKSAADNGIFTVRGGAIRSLVRNDFTVNQGRVFSLGGGDITLVSQFGNIDAGRGAKTASSAPPPLLTTDAAGNTRIDIAGSIAGSGIATLQTSPSQAAGDVLAAAPRGIFDAGDAGVRSSGRVEVQASVVLNAGNIAASGGVGGSSAVTASLAGGATAAATAAPAVADPATTQPHTAPKETLAVSVDVLCYGGEGDGDHPCKAEGDDNVPKPQRPGGTR